MKLFTYLILFGLMSVLSAAPTESISHSHSGRIHSHPLPVIGVSHRHGSGALGIRANNQSNPNNDFYTRSASPTGRISSRVIYGSGRSTPTKQAPRRRVTTSQIPRSTPIPQTPRTQYRSNTRLSRGDVNCRYGQTDCNVCAVNVLQSFQKATKKQLRWQSQPWRFNWPSTYPPQRKRPLDIFNGEPVHALGIPDKHIQGFVRTNSSRYPFAGSHSHKSNGGIFVIKQEASGKMYLSSLHQLGGRHPSGVHMIGKYLVYGLNDRLYFKDINSPNQQTTFNLKIPRPGFGGGLGAVKLSRDRHLIITSGPGGQDKRPRYHRFYILKSINGRPTSISLSNESSLVHPNKWPSSLAFSENLSVITECGTGDIYTIHSSGDEKGMSAITGNGYWRLSKLVDNQNSLSLRPLNAFSIRQNMTSCNVRSAATVHVNAQHQLEFYCHGYAKDPDGTTFNVLGKSSRGIDKFYFKKGTLRNNDS